MQESANLWGKLEEALESGSAHLDLTNNETWELAEYISELELMLVTQSALIEALRHSEAEEPKFLN